MRSFRSTLLRLGYNLVFLPVLVLALPWLVVLLLRRGAWREQFGERFGRFDESTRRACAEGEVIWLHAVSVGEVNLVVRLLAELQRRRPDAKWVVSTTTTTGMNELRRRLPATVRKVYYPLDFWGWVHRSFRVIRPRAVVLVEAEIWPNFLWRARDLGVPVFLVNARVSERSRRRYQQAGFLFRDLFGGLGLACCGSEAEGERLCEVGCRPEAVRVVGNLKFDLEPTPAATRSAVAGYLARLGVTGSRPILLGGSTHAGEEQILGRVLQRLRPEHPGLFLVVVPRHFERAGQAARDLEALGLRVARRSEDPARGEVGAAPEALVVDTTGELRAFYEHATVVFVGKSLAAHGGQNPIEPAAEGRAVVVGPNMENFRNVMEEMRRRNAVVEVADEPALTEAVRGLLADSAACEALGRRAREAVAAGVGAVARTADEIAGSILRSRA